MKDLNKSEFVNLNETCVLNKYCTWIGPGKISANVSQISSKNLFDIMVNLNKNNNSDVGRLLFDQLKDLGLGHYTYDFIIGSSIEEYVNRRNVKNQFSQRESDINLLNLFLVHVKEIYLNKKMCQLPYNNGKGKLNQTYYFFDGVSGCDFSVWKGGLRSLNHFNSSQDCERVCLKGEVLPLNSTVLKELDNVSLDYLVQQISDLKNQIEDKGYFFPKNQLLNNSHSDVKSRCGPKKKNKNKRKG